MKGMMRVIIPIPKYEEYYEQKYILKSYDENLDLVNLYNKYKDGNQDVTIVSNALLDEDAYEFHVSDKGVTITASCSTGIFRAVSTFKQLLKQYKDELPYCNIKDNPDFKRRGYMLEISEGRMPTCETFTRLIDLLADLKYNEFQIYMENFVFKFKAYPKYTQDFDCLTPEDIIYLDKYCKDRFIDLVPCLNGFGHMKTWLAQDEFKHLDVSGGVVNTATINPLLPESLEFMDNLYESLLPCFSSKYVNIGLDEATGLGKYALEDVCNEKGREHVFMDWLNKLADHIKKKYNKNVLFWSDMVCEYPGCFGRIPDGAIALNWGYDVGLTTLMEKRCADLKAKNVPYYICSGNSNWLSYTGRFDVASLNIRSCSEFGRTHGALGYLVTDWGGNEGHSNFPVWSLVPAVLAGQYAWNVCEVNNGGNLKPYNIYNAEKYVDDNIFGGAKVSRWLYRMQQWYLLEPERLHCATMCGFIIRNPLSETAIPHFFDLKECGDDFYFNNITEYMKKCITGIETIDFDENWKRQVIINGKMVILSSELCIVRMHQACNNDKIDELSLLIDDIIKEYAILWDRENYPKGKEIFINILKSRKAELVSMRS